jgi:hypothetical protein
MKGSFHSEAGRHVTYDMKKIRPTDFPFIYVDNINLSILITTT